MALTVRYSGSWFRPDVALYALFGCVLAAALWYTAQPFLRSPHIAASSAIIIPGLLVVLVGYFVFSAVQLLITIRRFQLRFDQHEVSYRRMFRESTYPRAQIAVLRWDPGNVGRGTNPGYLLFKNPEGDTQFRILGSLLSREQLKDISQALAKPILDLPER
jgi:hypothetical protein